MKTTPNDRLVFELVEAGLISDIRRPLYEPGVTRLLEAGLIVLRGNLYEPIDAASVGRRADGSSRLTPPGPPKPPPMGQMQVRIPQPWIDAMVASAEEHGVDKSKVLRDLLRPHFEPGVTSDADEADQTPPPPPARASKPRAKAPKAQQKATLARRRKAG